jgi:hypothetical protein
MVLELWLSGTRDRLRRGFYIREEIAGAVLLVIADAMHAARASWRRVGLDAVLMTSSAWQWNYSLRLTWHPRISWL